MSLILRAHVAAAAHDVVSSWPLESFIAINPLASRESQPFETSATPDATLTRSHDAYLSDYRLGRIDNTDLEAALIERIPALATSFTVGTSTIAAVRAAVLDLTTVEWGSPRPADGTPTWIDEYVAAWVSTYLNPDPLWMMPHSQRGLFGAWRRLARHDTALPRRARRKLGGVPPEPDGALAWALNELEIPSVKIVASLREELTRLPGWVGHIKWRADRIGDIDIASYLAVRFVLRAILDISPVHTSGPSDTGNPEPTVWQRAETVTRSLLGSEVTREHIAAIARVLANHPVTEHPYTWQKAYEIHYRAALMPALMATDEVHGRPEIQLVMCIDPRSEGMRRHLENDPGVETFGFAGFFGIPMRFARYRARGSIDSLPALLTARHHLTEDPTDMAQTRRLLARARDRDAFRKANHHADSNAATPFAFAEVTGWIFGAASILRTFTPVLHARLARALTPAVERPDSTVTVADSFDLQDRAAMARTAVRMMGMTGFAPLVVLAGHRSESANNLFESALDCGACGGNPGAANARAAAAIFNDPAVRELLSTGGIQIPADTVFAAAEHNTATDAMTLLDQHLLPRSHDQFVQKFDRLSRTAGDHLLRERANDLPGASRRRSSTPLRARAHDWAEVYPELGLAGNAAMIIGPRRITRGVDLGRRVFLHSYESGEDPDGTALETIMTAPLVVAQWINHQYYFSALNPTTLGAGTKTIHNAVGTIGVLAGGSGDLRRGLPWQSVGCGTELFHEPMRLAVVIQAPLERVGDIVSRNQVLRNLLDNDWITLTARHDSTAAWHRYTRYGWSQTPITTEGRCS